MPDRALNKRTKAGARRFAARIRHRSRGNSLAGSSRNIRVHYDLGNDFYRLFLDKRMLYSCAYFSGKDDTIDLAQEQKLDLICRKLQIEPGERVLEREPSSQRNHE